jgi:hypothetical protein
MAVAGGSEVLETVTGPARSASRFSMMGHWAAARRVFDDVRAYLADRDRDRVRTESGTWGCSAHAVLDRLWYHRQMFNHWILVSKRFA